LSLDDRWEDFNVPLQPTNIDGTADSDFVGLRSEGECCEVRESKADRPLRFVQILIDINFTGMSYRSLTSELGNILNDFLRECYRHCTIRGVPFSIHPYG